MYELDQAKRDQKEANDRAWRLSQQHTKDERTILDLTYKLRLAESLGGSGTMPFRGGRPMNGSKGSAYDVLHLKPDAPPEVVAAAYKALAFKHHPDRGGDEEEMKRINDSHDRIKEDMKRRGDG
jgi:DnaJ-class molecular chaperone